MTNAAQQEQRSADGAVRVQQLEQQMKLDKTRQLPKPRQSCSKHGGSSSGSSGDSDGGGADQTAAGAEQPTAAEAESAAMQAAETETTAAQAGGRSGQ